jgi:hypothetical protein
VSGVFIISRTSLISRFTVSLDKIICAGGGVSFAGGGVSFAGGGVSFAEGGWSITYISSPPFYVVILTY